MSRRRLLRAGVIGAGALTVAPQLALRAIASGLDSADGMRSVVRSGTGELLGLVGTPTGTEVRQLVVGDDGAVRLGSRVLRSEARGPSGSQSIALGLTSNREPIVLGVRLVEVAPSSLDAGRDLLERLVDPLLAAEPAAPYGLAPNNPVRLVADAIDFAGRALAPLAGPGLTTATSGTWGVRQHGPDDEADHLSMLTVSRADEVVLRIDDLADAGVARLGGPIDAPVLSVADGSGALAVHPLDGSTAPVLVDSPATTLTRSRGAVVATFTDADGNLVLSRLDQGAWRFVTAVAGTAGTTGVLAVGGSSEVVATGPAGARLLDLAEVR